MVISAFHGAVLQQGAWAGSDVNVARYRRVKDFGTEGVRLV